MKRNRNDNAKKERIIMLASSAFVLAALTMTGIYMQSKNAEPEDDGYTIDFTAMEDNVDNKLQEIAQNDQAQNQPGSYSSSLDNQMPETASLDDDLDYMPMEVGSGLIQIPGLTDGLQEEADLTGEKDGDASQGTGTTGQDTEDDQAEGTPAPDVTQQAEETATDPEGQAVADQGMETPVQAEDTGAAESNVIVTRTLHFAETDGLLRPLAGETLIPYSMDGSVYFSTLDQYKYNPALMIAAAEGTVVTACAEGHVIDIFENEEIGHAVTMELGDGYLLTYGQLKDIQVTLGSYVDPGTVIANVAAPTKYFSVEGGNLYLKLTADGTPVNPEALFR